MLQTLEGYFNWADDREGYSCLIADGIEYEVYGFKQQVELADGVFAGLQHDDELMTYKLENNEKKLMFYLQQYLEMKVYPTSKFSEIKGDRKTSPILRELIKKVVDIQQVADEQNEITQNQILVMLANSRSFSVGFGVDHGLLNRMQAYLKRSWDSIIELEQIEPSSDFRAQKQALAEFSMRVMSSNFLASTETPGPEQDPGVVPVTAKVKTVSASEQAMTAMTVATQPSMAKEEEKDPIRLTHSGIPSLDQLESLRLPGGRKMKINVEASAKYTTVGIYLLRDRTGAKVDAIYRAKLGNPMDTMTEVFKKWLRGEGRSVSWNTLINALHHADLNTAASDISSAMLAE